VQREAESIVVGLNERRNGKRSAAAPKSNKRGKS
jgi:hypothetical protein